MDVNADVATRRTAAVAVAAAGGLHLVLVPEYLAELPWLGVSFLVAGAATGCAAYRLWRSDDTRAWILAVLVSGGMILGFVSSRTLGLFGYGSADWAEGIPSLLVEVVVLALFARRAAVMGGRRRVTR